MKHIALPHTDNHESAFKAGFIRSLQEAIQNDVSEILFLISQKSVLENNIISNALGSAFVKKLLLGNPVLFNDTGVKIRAKTLKTIELSIASEVIISVYLPPKDVDRILRGAYAAKSCIFVPWLKDEFEEWNKLKEPEIIDVQSCAKTL